MENRLEQLKQQAIARVVEAVKQHGRVAIAFSGGKDSHAVLGIAMSAVETGLVSRDNFVVVHADTTIEYPKMVNLSFKSLKYVGDLGYKAFATKALPENRLFARIFGYGIPVSNYANRWCTDFLKIKPMDELRKNLGISITLTGEHVGESQNRDRKIAVCGSPECGTEKLLNTLRPIENWRNCDVWDYLFEMDISGSFYPGFFNEISSIYAIAEDDKGSLRTGCMGCPVIATNKHYNTEAKGCPSALSLSLRMLFAELSNDDFRLKNPRPPKNGTRKLGAIALPVRKHYWNCFAELNQKFLANGIVLVSDAEAAYIKDSLARGRYPKTYTAEMIRQGEQEWRSRCPSWFNF